MPKNWLLADLLFEQLCNSHENLTLQKGENSGYFTVENYTIVTNGSLENLAGTDLMLDVLASRPPYERVLTISARVVQAENAPRFASDIYEMEIPSTTTTEVELIFQHPVALKHENSTEIFYGPSSSNDLFQILNFKEFGKGSYAKVWSNSILGNRKERSMGQLDPQNRPKAKKPHTPL